MFFADDDYYTYNEYEVDIEPNSIVRSRLTPFQNGDLPAVNYWPIPDLLDSNRKSIMTSSKGSSIHNTACNPFVFAR